MGNKDKLILFGILNKIAKIISKYKYKLNK